MNELLNIDRRTALARMGAGMGTLGLFNSLQAATGMMDWHKGGATTSGRAAAMGGGANAGLLGENKKHTKLLHLQYIQQHHINKTVHF